MRVLPFLHDLLSCVRAPTVVLGGIDGQLRATGAQGAFCGSVRVLSKAILKIDGLEPEPLVGALVGPAAARFVSITRRHSARGVDPTMRVERHREALATGFQERVRIVSTADDALDVEVVLELEADLAGMHTVRSGLPAPPPAGAALNADAVVWAGANGIRVCLHTADAMLALTPGGATASWSLQIPPRGCHELSWRLNSTVAGALVREPAAAAPWTRPSVEADDLRLASLVTRSLDDLEALRLTLPDRPADQFVGAGSPWFMTLFGRDSIWAARMLLPLGTGLAAGTLAALASRQGGRHQTHTAEAPGKILHEVYRPFEPAEDQGAPGHPPIYYGSVDATSMWIVLLHDAWRWGLDPEVVGALLPHLEAALAWLRQEGDPDGDGFVKYVNTTGRGLENQGWKDSFDGVRFRDGTIATGPIALAEVQGYAHEAARDAATLLTAFDRPGADRWLEWADALARRFRGAFWVSDEVGGYPAMALDGARLPVDALTSNIGHLLGTGLLNAGEARLVADRLTSADLDSGYGLRTMSARDSGFAALSYHCGSVWPHDTAIAISGLVREGLGGAAACLVKGLLAAAGSFDNRLPELYAGDPAGVGSPPVPYPAACRPQAWAAAAAVSVLGDLLGVQADVPGGTLQVDPMGGTPVGALDVRGLQVAGEALDVAVDRDGRLLQATTAARVRVTSRLGTARPGGGPTATR